jgi:hypothetical protein
MFENVTYSEMMFYAIIRKIRMSGYFTKVVKERCRCTLSNEYYIVFSFHRRDGSNIYLIFDRTQRTITKRWVDKKEDFRTSFGTIMYLLKTLIDNRDPDYAEIAQERQQKEIESYRKWKSTKC